MEQLQFYIRHQQHFLQDKLILVFKSKAARDYIKNKIVGSIFEEVTSEQAQHAARIGINGKVIPYGYTVKLSDEEMKQLNVADWEHTARLLAEGNERIYEAARNKGGQTHDKN